MMEEELRIQWFPLKGSMLHFDLLPGWVLQLTHNGDRTLAVWTNGTSVYTVESAQA